MRIPSGSLAEPEPEEPEPEPESELEVVGAAAVVLVVVVGAAWVVGGGSCAVGDPAAFAAPTSVGALLALVLVEVEAEPLGAHLLPFFFNPRLPTFACSCAASFLARPEWGEASNARRWAGERERPRAVYSCLERGPWEARARRGRRNRRRVGCILACLVGVLAGRWQVDVCWANEGGQRQVG